MAVGPDGRVWVACVGSSAICRIDPATAGVDLVVDLLHPTDPGLELGPVAVAVGADALWVASAVARSEDDLEAPILERRSLADGSLLGSVELPAGFPLVAHHAFGSVWVAIAGSGALVRVDPDRLAIIGTITMGADANAIADAAGALWVACPESSALLRIDPATDEIRKRLRVPSIGQVASGPHGLWVTTFDSRNEPGSDHGALRRVDPAGNRILDDGGPDWSSDAIAIDESGVWAAPVGRLTRYDPATRQVTADLKVGTMAKRLAVGPGHVWILYPFSIGFMSDEDAPGTLVRVDT